MKNTEIKNMKITAKIRTAMSVLAVCMLLGLAACSGMESSNTRNPSGTGSSSRGDTAASNCARSASPVT